MIKRVLFILAISFTNLAVHSQEIYYDQGKMADNDRSKGSKNPAEKRAVDNENRVRPKDKRTKYGGEDVY